MSAETLHTVYLALGSNMGDRTQQLDMARQLIEELVGHVERCSSYHETEPWGFQSDNRFLNAALCCTTTLSPRQLLRATQRIERQLGRTRKSRGGHYSDRPIDIDILLYDDIALDQPDLQIPHPRMHERKFVMEPLGEICEIFASSDRNL